MRPGWLAFWVWLLALVQAYFISGLSASTFSINLVLAALLYVALERSQRLTILLAAWAGLWLDIAAAQLGPRIISLLLLVLGIRWAADRLGLEFSRRGIQTSSVFMLAFIYQVLILIFSWLALRSLNWQWELLGWWVLEAALTALAVQLCGRFWQAKVRQA